MRSRLGISISLTIAAIAAGMVLTTAASGQAAVHVVLPFEGLRATTVDIHHDGLRLGDRITARAPLLDETQTERVGTAYAQCIVHKAITGPETGLWNCNYVLELADGDIVLQGLDPRGPGTYEMAVIGGTDTYAGANGDATFTDVGTEGVDPNPHTDVVIRLRG